MTSNRKDPKSPKGIDGRVDVTPSEVTKTNEELDDAFNGDGDEDGSLPEGVDRPAGIGGAPD